MPTVGSLEPSLCRRHGLALVFTRLLRPQWAGSKIRRTDGPVKPGALKLRQTDEADLFLLSLEGPSSRCPDSVGRRHQQPIPLRTGRPRSKLVRFIDFWMTKGVPHSSGLSADPTRAGDVRAITEKAAALCFEATVRYGIVTPTGGHGPRQRLKAGGHGIVGAFAMFDGRNHLTRRRLPRPWQALCARRLGRGDLYSAGELAALAHLPVDRSVAGLSRAGAHAVAPPPEVRSGGKVLGRAEGGSRRAVGLSVADARQHLQILGATGSGKSTLLSNLVLQDVREGRGAVVIDPKGDLVNDLLDRLPAEVAGRVVVLDPDDDTAPPAMNVLDAAEPHLAVDHLAVDHLVGIFHRLFEAYWGSRTDDVLRVAALTALRQPGATLADIPRLLTEAAFRAGLTRRLDPTLKGFWQSYEQMSPAAQSQMVGPVMNKLRVVLTRPFVSAVLGSATSSFDLGADVLDGGLLLARLPKGTFGEDSCRLLGSFVVAKVWQTVTARARHGQTARRDAALYLDEAQNFLTLPGSNRGHAGRGPQLPAVGRGRPPTPRSAPEGAARRAVGERPEQGVFQLLPRRRPRPRTPRRPRAVRPRPVPSGCHQAAARLVVDWEEAPAVTLRTEAVPAPAGQGETIRAAARERFGRDSGDRHDEDLRRRLAGRRGTGRHRTGGDVSVGRSDGRPAATSGSRPELPGSPWAKRQHAGYLTSAGGDPDSWSDL